MFHKVKLLVYVALSPFLLYSLLDLSPLMFSFIDRTTLARQGGRLIYSSAAMLIVSSVIFFIAFFDLFREIAFPKDRDNLLGFPLSPTSIILYRMYFTMLKSAPFIAVLTILPLSFLWYYSNHTLALILPIALILVYVISLIILALFLVCVTLRLGTLWSIPYHIMYVLLYLCFLFSTTLLGLSLLRINIWTYFIDSYASLLGLIRLLPHHQLAYILNTFSLMNTTDRLERFGAFLLMVVLSSTAAFWASLRLWPSISRPLIAGRRKPIFSLRFGQKEAFFSKSRPWAILQKDLKDLLRNPVYRYSVVGMFVFLPLSLWAQAKTLQAPAAMTSDIQFRRLMMLSLNLLHLVPLLFSARAISIEGRMLECYRTLLSNVGQILEIKLRAQAIVNYLATILLALPLFLLLGPTLRFFEVTYFLVAATLCVPIFTMLAIAIGTYFPNSSRTPQFLGIRIKGALLYFVFTLPIYSLLLELHGDLLLGKKIVSILTVTTLVGISVTLFSLILYFLAKRKLAFSTT